MPSLLLARHVGMLTEAIGSQWQLATGSDAGTVFGRASTPVPACQRTIPVADVGAGNAAAILMCALRMEAAATVAGAWSSSDPDRKLTTFRQAGETRTFNVPCEHSRSEQRTPKLPHPRDAALGMSDLQSLDKFLCLFDPAEHATRSHLKAQSRWIGRSNL